MLFHSVRRYAFRKTNLPKYRILSRRNRLNPALIQNNWWDSNCKCFSQKYSFEGPGLANFIQGNEKPVEEISLNDRIPYIEPDDYDGYRQRVYFEVYGCQMNVSDTEIVWSILKKHNYVKTDNVTDADIILLMTCAIREGAENKIWGKIRALRGIVNQGSRKIKFGILGCMAERLKQKALEVEKSVSIVCGPDSYKDLPRLLSIATSKKAAINVLLSIDETYADVTPVRMDENSISAYVSIMRGCDNMCTYCIVPFTRGRERSRPVSSILDEVCKLSEQGVKDIVLLGQNVNSYRDTSEVNTFSAASKEANLTNTALGFKTVYKPKAGGLRFATLLDKVSEINPEMRIRFTSPHPKDFPDDVLHIIQERPNICKSLHLPAQSGSSSVLERMRRGYTREAYLNLVERAREIVPGVYLTSDFIAGFCGETEQEFSETLSLIRLVRYNFAYLFAYSMREKTTAYRRYTDDVEQSVKLRRCAEMTDLFRDIATEVNKAQEGEIQLVLIEKITPKNSRKLLGRNDGSTKVIIPNISVPVSPYEKTLAAISVGDYVAVLINDSNSQVLKGTPLFHTTLSKFNQESLQVSDAPGIAQMATP